MLNFTYRAWNNNLQKEKKQHQSAVFPFIFFLEINGGSTMNRRFPYIKIITISTKYITNFHKFLQNSFEFHLVVFVHLKSFE